MTIHTAIMRFAAGGIVASAALVPARAFASCANYAGGSCGGAGSIPMPATAVSSTTSRDAGLPFTGGDVFGLSLIGIGAITSGTTLARSGRRKGVGE